MAVRVFDPVGFPQSLRVPPREAALSYQTSCIMPTILHCGGNGGTRASHPTLQSGHFFLDTRRSLLLCLNETAQQLFRAGLPITRQQLAQQPLATLAGTSV